MTTTSASNITTPADFAKFANHLAQLIINALDESPNKRERLALAKRLIANTLNAAYSIEDSSYSPAFLEAAAIDLQTDVIAFSKLIRQDIVNTMIEIEGTLETIDE